MSDIDSFKDNVNNHDFKKFSVAFINLVKWFCTAVSYLTRPIGLLGGSQTLPISPSGCPPVTPILHNHYYRTGRGNLAK